MAEAQKTLLIDGTFEDLSQEFATYIDEVKQNTTLTTEIGPLLTKGEKDEVLKKLVTAAAALNAAPEKGT